MRVDGSGSGGRGIWVRATAGRWLRLRGLTLGLATAGLGGGAHAVPWESAATGGSIEATVTEPVPAVPTPALVVYLKNLSCERVGQEPDASILADFSAGGFRVVELDYAGHGQATTPFLNADVLRIRNDIGTGRFPGSRRLNDTKNQCYILCEGYRLVRNVPYFLNDPAVYSGTDRDAELRMDIAYPSQPSRPVPVVLEFSTSNSYDGNEDDRMRNDFAFTGTEDTILEGAPAAGIAWAMADHPKYRSWGSPKVFSGFGVNPDTIQKVRSSVRVLRETGAALGLSGNIAVHGFSRGASAGAMAAGDLAVPEIDSAGYATALSGRVNAVLLGSGIYDYTHAGGATTGDPPSTRVDIYDRFVTAWGPTASNLELWESQGALAYMATGATAPVFLSYNSDDGAYYPYQAKRLAAKLAGLGVPHEVVTGTGGHKVTTDPATLTAIYEFFSAHAKDAPNPPGPAAPTNRDAGTQTLDLTVDPNGNGGGVIYAIQVDGTPARWVQGDGTVGDTPAWRRLVDWRAPVQVGPLEDYDTATFTVLAYDRVNFTTARSGTAPPTRSPLPPIRAVGVDPATGGVTISWPAPDGVTAPAGLAEVLERATDLGGNWSALPGAATTITGGTVTFTDPSPPAGTAFYRVARP